MYDPDGDLKGDGFYIIAWLLIFSGIGAVGFTSCMAEYYRLKGEAKEEAIREEAEKTVYCITVEDENVYLQESLNVYKGYEDAEYYYCYVDENTYELLPIKDTKIVGSLEEAEELANHYEDKGYNIKWDFINNFNKKQASI